ncbi:MAG: methylmalonyl-CoA mutase small subunit [Propionibacteriaceae bacterium]|jgi:methylmalonyl-CoA mutase|nr:methylmalonyl-CoA mutase small subunit [Propionibacteriaceae bacterium]
MTDMLQLAGDFAAPTWEEWEVEVLKVLNRRRPPGKELTIEQALARLRSTSVDGLTIEPLYTKYEGELGYPGVAPFTRGTTVKDGDMDAWDVRTLHEDPDAAFTNKEILADLERGATSIWLRVGADAIKAEDVSAALAGVNPDVAALSVSSYDDQIAAAFALAGYISPNGEPTTAKGSLGLDPIGFAAVNGKTPEVDWLAEWVNACLREAPGMKAICVDLLPYDNAGAGEIQQVAIAAATGVAYLRALEAAGISPTDAMSQIEFRVAVNANQFTSIAKLRAFRRVWDRIGEACGVPADKRGAVQHAVTSWRMLTRDDTYVNLLRTTIACFAGAVGVAESVTVLPFDTAHGLPTDFSRRLARNIQLLAAEESNIGRVNDPAGGAYFVEAYTDQLAEKAWDLFQQIEAAGGMADWLTSGEAAKAIAVVNAERAKRLATRKLPITGVSMFPREEEVAIDVRQRPAAPERGGLSWHRDAEVFEALRDRSALSDPKPQVFLACLGERREFGGREGFTKPLFAVAGIALVQSEGGTPAEIAAQASAAGAKCAVLASSAKVYADQGIEVAKALKAAGVETVYIAGRKAETGTDEADSVIDGEIFDGMDVVAFLSTTLDKIGAAK